jgi:hypothetical protein
VVLHLYLKMPAPCAHHAPKIKVTLTEIADAAADTSIPFLVAVLSRCEQFYFYFYFIFKSKILSEQNVHYPFLKLDHVTLPKDATIVL